MMKKIIHISLIIFGTIVLSSCKGQYCSLDDLGLFCSGHELDIKKPRLVYGFSFSGDTIDFTQIKGLPVFKNKTNLLSEDDFMAQFIIASSVPLIISNRYILFDESIDADGVYRYYLHSSRQPLMPYQEFAFPVLKTKQKDGVFFMTMSFMYGDETRQEEVIEVIIGMPESSNATEDELINRFVNVAGYYMDQADLMEANVAFNNKIVNLKPKRDNTPLSE